MPATGMEDITNFTKNRWYLGTSKDNHSYAGYMFRIPAGTKNILINTLGDYTLNTRADNDIEIYTLSGKHLVGGTQDNYSFGFSYINDGTSSPPVPPADGNYSTNLGFDPTSVDESDLNQGPGYYNAASVLAFSTYNGMTIGYTGDPDLFDDVPNDIYLQNFLDYEIATISEATEDLIVWLPGAYSSYFKVLTDVNDMPSPENSELFVKKTEYPDISTQKKAQKTLPAIDEAIAKKDTIRAHLGAMQNRLENTITNITTQAENLQASESRISDVDVAQEMTEFIRQQILSQTATAILSQANSLPQLAKQLIQS